MLATQKDHFIQTTTTKPYQSLFPLARVSRKEQLARQKVFSTTSRHTEIAVTSLHLCQQNPNGELGLPLHQASLKEATTPTSSASMLPKTQQGISNTCLVVMSLHCLSYTWRWIRDSGASPSPGSNNALPQLSVGTVSVRTSITQDFTIVLVRQRLCSCPVHCVIAHYPFPDRIT